MTIVCLKDDHPGWMVLPMDPDALTLARLLALAALIAATTEYAEVIKRRVVRHAEARERAVLEERSLQGLVRVLLADGSPTEAPAAG
jgi:hypothetical protein